MKFRKKGEQTQKHTVIEAYQTTVPMTIHTPDGVMKAEPTDWIITGVCDDKLFRETYKPVNNGVIP